MFEHATLEGSYGNRRAFATGAGFAGQAALAAFIVIAPMIWPQVLPKPRFTITITPPPPAPPERMTAVKPRTPRSPAPFLRTELLIPVRIPAQPQQFVDAPPQAPPDLGRVAGGIGNPLSGGGFLDSLLNTVTPVPKPVVQAPEHKAASGEVKRIRVSSLDPGRLIHVVQPVYPAIAKSVHISGTVELRAVIGAGGRVRDLTVISGHPLLRNAAIEAVRQWIYKPPVLNGESVELVAPIAVVFRLN